ncbi:MAG: HAMP domain-containing sensor histidine kinase [Acetobacteraceae bacterium]
MSESGAEPHRVRPRQSLSGRLWLLTTLAVLLSEVLVFLPYIAHERSVWLAGRVEDASIAVLAFTGGTLDAAKRDDLLRLTGAEAIRFRGRDGVLLTIGDVERQQAAAIDLGQEDLLVRVRRALRAILLDENRLIRLSSGNTFRSDVQVEVWLHERDLNRTLRAFAGDFAGLALLIAGVTGGLVYLAVLLLLVRPMRRLTGSIAAFRADPERTTPLDPSDVTVLPNDEMAVAGQELAAMQHELRAALWRNARLAALGTVVAKVSHDLRGILTPALLSAERLQLNADPKVQRAGDTLVQAVERAADLVRRTLDYAREGPPPLELGAVALAPLVNEAVETARPLRSTLRLRNGVDPAVLVRADRIQLFRVLANLMRNAAEAGARTVHVAAHPGSPTLAVEIADDGPGLPEAVQADLFRPFAGSMRRGGTGLGLAIARDLMVAHGGDIELVATGPGGTTFRLTLRVAEPPQPPIPAAGTAQIAPAASADV